ncbi:MAG: hypothetical protein WC748_10040 [Legionellales bacterium]|jgi:hypothetical protein
MATKLSKVSIVNDESCVSTEELAKLFAVSVQTIGGWTTEGMPKSATGYYPIIRCMRWFEKSSHFITRARAITEESISGKNLSDSERKLKNEANLKQLQAEAQFIKNAFQRGDYLIREEVVRTLSTFFINLKKSFHSFGRTTSIYISPFCDENTGRKIDADYRLMIDDFLRRLSEGMNYEEQKKNRKFKSP